MPNREFKIIVLSMLRMLQYNTDKQLNKIKKTIQEENYLNVRQIENK